MAWLRGCRVTNDQAGRIPTHLDFWVRCISAVQVVVNLLQHLLSHTPSGADGLQLVMEHNLKVGVPILVLLVVAWR